MLYKVFDLFVYLCIRLFCLRVYINTACAPVELRVGFTYWN